MNAAALIERHAESLTLIRRETTQNLDTESGAPSTAITDFMPWSGLGSLQPALGSKPAVAGSVAGVEEVLVAFQAYLPWDAHPGLGWIVRDSVGREFEQVTKPVNPGGAGSYWLLNLGAPTIAPSWVYISTGLWVDA